MGFDDVPYLYPVEKVEIAGIPTAYVDAGRGPAVVFVHGNGADLSTFDGVYPAVAAGRRVIAVDLPGFGKSAKPELDFGAEWYADHLDALLARLAVDRCVLVGHSFGGLVALNLALAHPGRVSALVLTASPGAYRYPEFQANFMRAAFTPEATIKATPEQIRAGMEFALGQWRDEYQVWIDKRVALSRSADYPAYARASYRALLSILDTRIEDRLGEIRVPALLVWGGRDNVVPRQAGDALQKALPKARLEVIDEAGHFPMLTHRDRFLELLAAFLTEVAP